MLNDANSGNDNDSNNSNNNNEINNQNLTIMTNKKNMQVDCQTIWNACSVFGF